MSGKAGDIAVENGADRGGIAADIKYKIRIPIMVKNTRLFMEDFFWNRQMSFICITIIYY